jgi:hypothetical protein
MTRQSLDMGYEKETSPKDWRRNVGNTVNERASDAVRDQVMRHNKFNNHWHSGVFQDAFLNQHVCYEITREDKTNLGSSPRCQRRR